MASEELQTEPKVEPTVEPQAKRRVVVTGIGSVTPVGLTAEESWKNIVAGKSGVAIHTEYSSDDFPTKIAARVKDFDIHKYLDVKEARKIDVFVQYGLAAATEALNDSSLDLEKEDRTRIGVAVGSGIGGLDGIVKGERTFTDKGPRRISPYFIPGSIINMASGYISIYYHLKGPNISIVTACTTGAHNIGYAARTIASGDADVMVAGGTEMASIPLGIAGFAALRALSSRNDEPEKASRPWDKDRDGFVLGDGAGILILEEYEHAKARGAKIYAELVGFGMSADGEHMTAPNQDGMERSMLNALKDAKLNPEDVQYINAHGTSTPVGDPVEAAAVEKVFENSLDKLTVSSTKSMIGHLLGAAGAVEAIFSVLAIRDQVSPPTINLDNPIETKLDLVPNHARETEIKVALSNSFGFGGTNGTLIFKKI
jgi:3-oxoacyl-[acyl-carrier-protein] synthase II